MLVQDKDIKEIKLNIGAFANGGTAVENKTGGWRTFKPVLDRDKCVDCMICWLNCPDDSIIVRDSKMLGFDYDYCKGCGICANVCPRKAIDMVSQED